MNKWIGMGRLTKDVETRTTSSQIPVASFTLAVDRRFKSADGQKQADFIPIIAWRQQAEFAAKYFRKGSRMVVVGSIQTRSWDGTDGTKHYATEVIADEIYFGDSKQTITNEAQQVEPGGSFPNTDETALPFDI